MYNKVEDFDYYLPEELIAIESKIKRDESKLLIAKNAQLLDLQFSNIVDFIRPNDLLILNNSKVIKARLYGNKPTGGKIEILVERILSNQYFTCHIRSNKTIPIGLFINLPDNLQIKVVEKLDGIFKVKVIKSLNIYEYLEQYGLIPLPPYMNREANINDAIFYQTVYAKDFGSVAAPTAGLHFTHELLNQIAQKGVQISYVTLHVGSGTFKPVSVDDICKHKMHSEIYTIADDTINLIQQTKQNGGSIIAVGTTSLRTLESVALNNYKAGDFDTDIFITPGFKFKVVDKLITNFHLPKSTLLMLVAAFAGYDNIKNIYQHAIDNKYKFFSYGDAMLLECEE
ncbi:MAG: tRNA preQ1(34) S-adenosylmethionine ribosyltransferase-isomerase QueA [Burkholderiales bacterium]|nr:tRNA preQ1(34) S-adenosylmethionine ribosyltransferase-isomerase QueA [Burkholderiales bacterium]